MNHTKEQTKKSENVMNDPTKISDVHIGVSTKISLLSSSNEFSEGVVYKVLSESFFVIIDNI